MQACEFRYESVHELPQASTQIEPAQARRWAQGLYDSDEEGKVIIVSDEREPECIEAGKEHVGRHAHLQCAGVWEDVVCTKDGGGCCGLVKYSVGGEKNEVMHMHDVCEDNMGGMCANKFDM
jgi:hypothetical protein